MKTILISQKIQKDFYETRCCLSTEWIDFFNNFDVLVIPILVNSNINKYLENYFVAGIVISGGNDLFKDNKFNLVSNKNLESKIRDEFEIELIKTAINNDIPLLGVCRGCQLIASINGFDIEKGENHVAVSHRLKSINKSKYFPSILKKDILVNSYHNDVIKYNNNVNNDILVTFTSEDGFIESFEYKNEKVLGIMWHPERISLENTVDNLNLISNFFNISIKKTKVFILCAGKGTRLRPLTDEVPKCMVKYKNIEIIDYILESLRINDLNDITLIKGYKHEKLNKKNTKEIINYKYDTTNMVSSLFTAEEYMDESSDIIISYSDIVYSPEIVQKLLLSDDPISVVIDKDWYNLWSQRMEDPLSDAETLKLNKQNYITEIGKKAKSYSEIEGQYIGLIKIKRTMVKKILNFYKTSNLDPNIYLTDFLTLISKNICPLKAVIINGEWAEFDTIEDLNYNLDVSWFKKNLLEFSSKANNLFQLQNNFNDINIAELFYFNHAEWEMNKVDLILEIKNKFKNKNVIVRSSSLNEDTQEKSNAGQFLSINNIKIDDDNNLEKAINLVFESYGEINSNDQILIQESLENIICCGVIFTFDIITKSYYYTVTYDETGSTDSVTSGVNNNNQKCIYSLKGYDNISNKYLKELIPLANKLEKIFGNDKLDIEFAFTKKKDKIILYLLQVRPLVVNEKKLLNYKDLVIYHKKIYKKYKKYLSNECFDLYGNKSILSVMTDWNPAEIIGLKPKQLSLSLYKEIITDNIAMLSRKECGYKDLTNHPLMISFINRPYINTRISFSSLIPVNLEEITSDKLCRYYIDKLENNPDLHDKVEFDICFTCNTVNLKNKLDQLKNYNFNEKEINSININLVELTNKIISPDNKRIEKEYEKLDKLKLFSKKIIGAKEKFETDKIFELTQIIKKYGTLPFSNLARYAFIGKSILLSFVEEKIITNERYNEFMETIHTVSKDMANDIVLLAKNKINKEQFLQKYGHLRPGTYDISSNSYEEDFDTYFSEKYLNDLKNKNIDDNKKKFNLSDNEKKKINSSLIKSYFNNEINAEVIMKFIKQSIESREYSKFIFTKTLSQILKIIKEIFNIYNISIEDGSNIDFKIFNEIYTELKLLPVKDIIMQSINLNKSNYNINNKLNLPQLIKNTNEIFEFEYINTKPTFITKKKIKSDVLFIDDKFKDKDQIINKIIVIENADPGWEWLFSRKINGLITCYGGMNSHMAIRCQELSIPAVIGCGPEKFNLIKCKEIIEINCDLEIVYGI